MYRAQVNGQSIDVENLTLTLKLKNPMFDPNGGMDWSASYPFTLPATPNNNKVFGFPGRLSNKNTSAIDFPFQHSFSGIRLPGDTIRVTKVSQTQIEAYVKIGRSDFISVNKDKLLTDLCFGVQEFQVSDHYHPNYLFSHFYHSYPVINFAIFPVRNKGYYSGTDDDLWWNDISRNPKGPYQNMVYYDEAHLIHYNPQVITPFPYVAAVIDEIFAESKYTLVRSFFKEDAELINLCIFNPNRCRYFEHPVTDDTVSIELQKHLPRIKVLDFFVSIRTPFGLDLYFNYYTNEVSLVSRQEIVNGSEIIDFSDKVSPNSLVYLDNAVTNFLFSMKGDSADSYWQERVKNMKDFLTTPFYQEVSDVTDLSGSIRGSIGFVKNEDSYYVFEVNQDTLSLEWQFLSLNLQDYLSGTGEDFKMESDISGLISENHEFAGAIGAYTPWDWDTPVTAIFGNFENGPNGMNAYADFGLRLMFRRGMATLHNEFSYPYGSSFNSFVTPDPDWEKFSLRWFGPQVPEGNSGKGLFTKFWKDWFAFKQTSRQVEFTKVMSAIDIYNLDFTKKYRALNINLLLDEINITITERSIQPANIKAWTV